MRKSSRRTSVALLAAAGLVLAVPGLASGHGVTVIDDDGAIDDRRDRNAAHHQHGHDDGHLPPSSTDNIDVVSRLKLKNVVEGKIADVGVFNGYAYLAAWGQETCKYNGVHVVDINDPANPEEVAFIVSKEGSAPGEGIQALHIDTPAFTGDILVSNNETCKDPAGFGGMNIYDVTNPEHPTPLAQGVGDFTVNGQGKKAANEIHSVFAWDAGDKAYAVIVDNEEQKDVDIVDITNPKKAKVIAEYDLDELFDVEQATPDNLVEIFHHDMIVKKIGNKYVMLVSYWDGGYVQLDVTDPRNATYMADTDFAMVDPEAAQSGLTVPPEGNAHQSEFDRDNRYVIAADEDFNPYALTARNVTDGTTITASPGNDTPPLEEGQTISGPSVFVGRACPGDPAVPPAGAGTQIAVVERGLCTFTEKVTSVTAAGGYEAILVFNRTAEDGCSTPLSMDVQGTLPSFGVAPRAEGFAIFNTAYDDAACLAGDGSQLAPIAIGTIGDMLTLSSYFDGWGYVHLFKNESGKMSELDTYAVPEAHDPAYADGFGDISVHEVAMSSVDADRAYFSYYSAGFRVVEIEDGQLVEKGHYVDADGNNFWGVQTFMDGGQEYVAASDRDHGLWIFKYTP